jgi:hypothetical protein
VRKNHFTLLTIKSNYNSPKMRHKFHVVICFFFIVACLIFHKAIYDLAAHPIQMYKVLWSASVRTNKFMKIDMITLENDWYNKCSVEFFLWLFNIFFFSQSHSMWQCIVCVLYDTLMIFRAYFWKKIALLNSLTLSVCPSVRLSVCPSVRLYPIFSPSFNLRSSSSGF